MIATNARPPVSAAALISKALFDDVQVVLRAKDNQSGHVKRKKTNPFVGWLKCANCGCTVCREVKRGKPYHACSNGKKICKREYTQETVLMEQLKPLFESIQLTDKQIESIVDHLRETHEYKARYHKEQLTKLDSSHSVIQSKKDSMLDLLLQDRISQEVYEKKMAQLDTDHENIILKRAEHTVADTNYHVTVKHVCLLARRAGELFERANDEEKNQILKLLLSNAVLKDKEITFTINSPFDSIISFTSETEKAAQCDPSEDSTSLSAPVGHGRSNLRTRAGSQYTLLSWTLMTQKKYLG